MMRSIGARSNHVGKKTERMRRLNEHKNLTKTFSKFEDVEKGPACEDVNSSSIKMKKMQSETVKRKKQAQDAECTNDALRVNERRKSLVLERKHRSSVLVPCDAQTQQSQMQHLLSTLKRVKDPQPSEAGERNPNQLALPPISPKASQGDTGGLSSSPQNIVGRSREFAAQPSSFEESVATFPQLRNVRISSQKSRQTKQSDSPGGISAMQYQNLMNTVTSKVFQGSLRMSRQPSVPTSKPSDLKATLTEMIGSETIAQLRQVHKERKQ